MRNILIVSTFNASWGAEERTANVYGAVRITIPIESDFISDTLQSRDEVVDRLTLSSTTCQCFGIQQGYHHVLHNSHVLKIEVHSTSLQANTINCEHHNKRLFLKRERHNTRQTYQGGQG